MQALLLLLTGRTGAAVAHLSGPGVPLGPRPGRRHDGYGARRARTAGDAGSETDRRRGRELLLAWLDHLRTSILAKLEDLERGGSRAGLPRARSSRFSGSSTTSRTWSGGGSTGSCSAPSIRSDSEFHPGPELTVAAAAARYRARAAKTEETARTLPLAQRCTDGSGRNFRWVLLHLIEETRPRASRPCGCHP